MKHPKKNLSVNYEGAIQRLECIRSLVAQNDPLFVRKLAVYAHTQIHPLLIGKYFKIISASDQPIRIRLV